MVRWEKKGREIKNNNKTYHIFCLFVCCIPGKIFVGGAVKKKKLINFQISENPGREGGKKRGGERKGERNVKLKKKKNN